MAGSLPDKKAGNQIFTGLPAKIIERLLALKAGLLQAAGSAAGWIQRAGWRSAATTGDCIQCVWFRSRSVTFLIASLPGSFMLASLCEKR
ncbi:MAG TPA: hypothetical protein VKY85_07075 [Candidatus Angelobacter sp.]|nr:hypothetical protein [Candidatus Angelobacter sp.]